MKHYIVTMKFLMYILKNLRHLPQEDIAVHGFGFLRLRIDENHRLHIWDSRLRVPNVSDIHDHAQWAFTSYVLTGQIQNIRYIVHEDGGSTDIRIPYPHRVARIKAGMWGKVEVVNSKLVWLESRVDTPYYPEDHYKQEPHEVHRTQFEDSTITLLTQERTDTDTARVFWPHNSEWVPAFPKSTSFADIEAVIASAIEKLQKEYNC